MSMAKCNCPNCILTATTGDYMPCVGLPPISTGTPMPPCKPPKQEDNLSEYKTLKKMMAHFEEKSAYHNKSLSAFGESRYCSPLKTIDVQELKDYMLTILEKEMNL